MFNEDDDGDIYDLDMSEYNNEILDDIEALESKKSAADSSAELSSKATDLPINKGRPNAGYDGKSSLVGFTFAVTVSLITEWFDL